MVNTYKLFCKYWSILTNFHCWEVSTNIIGMLMLSFGNFGTGKFPIRHSRHIPIPVRVTIFPHSWLSSCGKKKFLHSRLRRSWRNFFSPRLLSHSWGKIVTRTGIGMCLEWRIENFPSQNCQMTSLAFLICKWKLVTTIKIRMICTRYKLMGK